VSPSPIPNGQRPGKIVTFYSYKGGTGRSMALANVAWILASNGKRVLAIDWDLEAPGLQRYFHPFLEDKELVSTPGLIDFFLEFATAARQPRIDADERVPWHDPYTNLLRYAASLEWDFPDQGTLDFVASGQQGPGYAVNVNSFNWAEFYEKLGGGIFLETVKRRLRADYDYILIDSRTGISDTSGICTVQMPDELVVCFTLNQQSIQGAAAVTASVYAQRIKPAGEPGILIWPVPMRVEMVEKDKLDLAREFAHETFHRYLLHLPRYTRSYYWGRVEVLYQPYFAYEEVLATFADRRRQSASLLSSMETLTEYITGGDVRELGPMPEDRRLAGLAEYSRTRKPPATKIFISYRRSDANYVFRLFARLRLRFGSENVWVDDELIPGSDWEEAVVEQVRLAGVVLVVIGPSWLWLGLADPGFGTAQCGGTFGHKLGRGCAAAHCRA